MPDDGHTQKPRNPFVSEGALTFSDLLVRIESAVDLKPQKRRDIRSAIRSLARLIERAPSSIPADPRWLRHRLEIIHPVQAGLSEKRLANIKSDVLFALRHAGVVQTRPSRLTPFTAEWKALWDATTDDRTRWNLSRLFHYCSGLGINPADVNDTVISNFHVALVEESLIKGPDQLVRATIKLWNKARDSVPNWPPQDLTPFPSRRDCWTFPFDEFPEAFQQDVRSWMDHLRGDDLLADDAIPMPLRPSTLTHRKFQIRMAGSALVRRNTPIHAVTSLSTLVAIENFKEILRFMLDRGDGEATGAIYGVATTLKTVAKFHVKVPSEHLQHLAKICSRLKPKQKGLTEKNRRRLRQLDDPANVHLLLDLPRRLEARAKTLKTRDAAVTMQMAVAIELLIMTAIRLKNLTALKLGTNLAWTRPGRQGVLLLAIEPEDVKNAEPIEFELPKESSELIKRYVEHYRPTLSPDPDDWLFPGRFGNHKHPTGFSSQIKRAIYNHTGLDVTPHFMRHAGAKIFLEKNPAALEVVRRVLVHRTSDTTINYYSGFQTKAAAREFDRSILEQRRAPTPGRVRLRRRNK